MPVDLWSGGVAFAMGDEGEMQQDSGGTEDAAKEDQDEGVVEGKAIDLDAKCDDNGLLIMNKDGKKAANQMENDVEIQRKNMSKEGDSEDEECIPPALPPRPPPRTRQMPSCTCSCDFGSGEEDLQQRFQSGKSDTPDSSMVGVPNKAP